MRGIIMAFLKSINEEEYLAKLYRAEHTSWKKGTLPGIIRVLLQKKWMVPYQNDESEFFAMIASKKISFANRN